MSGSIFNAGVTWGGLANEFQYRSAVSVSAAPRVTLVGELLGRRLDGVGEIRSARVPHPTFSGVDTIRLIAVGDSTHNATALGGVKWNVAATILISASVSRQLGDRGRRSGAVAQVGLDFAWIR